MKAHRKLSKLNGRSVYDFPVVVTFGERASVLQINDYPQVVVTVTSHKAADAAQFVRDELKLDTVPCVEIEVFGPRGGIAYHSFHGWERAIGSMLVSQRSAQLSLQLHTR